MEALPAGYWPEDEALFETLNQFFVVEIWVESAASVEAPAAWRARMTHGPSGEQWVVRTLEELNCRIVEIMNTNGLL
jgi:hypothetical protein